MNHQQALDALLTEIYPPELIQARADEFTRRARNIERRLQKLTEAEQRPPSIGGYALNPEKVRKQVKARKNKLYESLSKCLMLKAIATLRRQHDAS